jgi:hypothetical protein
MKLVFSSVILVTLLLQHVFCSLLVPQNYYLTDFRLCETRWNISAVSSLSEFGVDAAFNELIPAKFPVSYSGSIREPYDKQLPLNEIHNFYILFQGKVLTFSLNPSIAFDLLNNKSSEEIYDFRPGLTGDYDDFYIKTRTNTTKHVQLDYGGVANLGIRINGGYITFAIGGKVVQHSGYSIMEQKLNNSGPRIEIYDYNREDLSHGFEAGMLMLKKAYLFGALFNSFAGVNIKYDKSRIPIHAANIQFDKKLTQEQVNIAYLGNTDIKRSIDIWLGLQPRSKFQVKRTDMFLKWKSLYGLTLDDSYISLRINHEKKTNYHFNAGITKEKDAIDTLASQKKVTESQIHVVPALFITKNISLRVPISVENPHINQLQCGFSGDIQIAIPFKNSLEVHTEINSGELFFNNSRIRGQFIQFPPVYYRAYAAFLKVDILCLL